MRSVRLRRPRYPWLWPVVLIGGAMLAFAALVVVAYLYRPVDTRWQTQQEEAAARERDIAQAFRDHRPLAPGEIPDGVNEMFTAFGATLRNDGIGAEAYWDFPRVIEEAGTFLPANIVRRFHRLPQNELEAGFRTNMAGLALRIRYEKCDVRSFRWVWPGKEAVLVVRHIVRLPDDTITTTKYRWWVTKGPTGWRLYDFEDLLGCGRMCALMGLAFQHLDRSDNQADFIQRMQAFITAQNQALEGNLEEARAAFVRIRTADFPTTLRAAYRMNLAFVELQLGNFDAAMKQIELGEPLDPTASAFHMLRAFCYFGQERYDAVIAPARAYMEAIGPDADVGSILGQALLQLERPDEAAVAFEQSLDDNPDNVDILELLRSCLKPEDKAQLGRRLMGLAEPAKNLVALLNAAYEADDLPAAEAYLVAFRAALPGNAEGIRQEISLHRSYKNDAPRALQTYALALPQVEGDQAKQDLIRDVAWSFLRDDQPLRMYEATPPNLREVAFDHLAIQLNYGDEDYGDEDDWFCVLSGLIDRHARDYPSDRRLPLHRAHLAAGLEEFDEAERLYLQAKEQSRDDAEREDIRRDRVSNWLQAGQPATAYERVQPAEATFRQVAQALIWNQQKELEPIVALHRTKFPQDPYLSYVEGRLAYSQGNWARAVPHLARFCSRDFGPDDPEHYNQEYAAELRVRCLVLLGRIPEAKDALTRYQDLVRNGEAQGLRYQEEVLLLLIDAMAGNVEEVETQILRREDDPWFASGLYRDADLGPLLRTGQYQRLRQHNIEPWWQR